jgi:hypothetical protein
MSVEDGWWEAGMLLSVVVRCVQQDNTVMTLPHVYTVRCLQDLFGTLLQCVY